MRIQRVLTQRLRLLAPSRLRSVFLACILFALFLFLPQAARRLVFRNSISSQDHLPHALRLMMSGHDILAQPDSLLSQANQRCVHPVLQPFGSKNFSKPRPINCSAAMTDWVYVTNGTCSISDQARRQYGNITCEYRPVLRIHDHRIRYGSAGVKFTQDGPLLQTDYFKVWCISSSGKTYNRTHAGVAWNYKVHERLRNQSAGMSNASPKEAKKNGRVEILENKPKSRPPPQSFNLSVFMYGLDSMARMAWMRFLPRTREYFLKILGGIELENFNNFGGNTPTTLLPILTGLKQTELPEARKGVAGAATSVDLFPWIWRKFSQRGYVTGYAEDYPKISTFNFGYPGFKNQPTDHYLRPFYLGIRKDPVSPPLCSGSTPLHIRFLRWWTDLFEMYDKHPKFFFSFSSNLSHDYNHLVQGLDSDLVNFLQALNEKGHLNSSLLILMSDHGVRWGRYRSTPQGRVEEHTPYFAFRFPPWFHQRHPDIIKNFKTNAKRLTTPLDIHDTLLDILNYSGPGKADLRRRSISLFQEIPSERTCQDAEVGPESCECMEWQPVNKSDTLVVQAAHVVIAKINEETETQRQKCAELTLSNITRSDRYGCDPENGTVNSTNQESKENPKEQSGSSCRLEFELFRMSLTAEPGSGHFQAVCSHDLSSGRFSVYKTRISRINEYGSQPACVQDKLPHLRPYCYCI